MLRQTRNTPNRAQNLPTEAAVLFPGVTTPGKQIVRLPHGNGICVDKVGALVQGREMFAGNRRPAQKLGGAAPNRRGVRIMRVEINVLYLNTASSCPSVKGTRRPPERRSFSLSIGVISPLSWKKKAPLNENGACEFFVLFQVLKFRRQDATTFSTQQIRNSCVSDMHIYNKVTAGDVNIGTCVHSPQISSNAREFIHSALTVSKRARDALCAPECNVNFAGRRHYFINQIPPHPLESPLTRRERLDLQERGTETCISAIFFALCRARAQRAAFN